jgi:hypothetical protein
MFYPLKIKALGEAKKTQFPFPNSLFVLFDVTNLIIVLKNG